MLNKHHLKDEQIQKLLEKIEETEGSIQIASGLDRVHLNETLDTHKANLELRKHAVNKEIDQKQNQQTQTANNNQPGGRF